MFKRLRRRREKEETLMEKIGPTLRDEIAELFIKVIGETFRDRVARAIIVGLISSLGPYAVSMCGTDKKEEVHAISSVHENAP